MKICVINPNSSASMTDHIRRALEPLKRPDTELTVVNPAAGPLSIESEVDRVEAIPHTLELVRRANAEGFHAIVLACFSDPGIAPAREISRIPVFGIEAATLHVAAMLGHKFSPVTAFARHIPTREMHVRMLGLGDFYASTGVTNLTVLQMDADEALARERALAAARQAIRERGAEVIVLGCAGLAGYAGQMAAELGAVVLDPTAVAFKVAEAMAGTASADGISADPARDEGRHIVVVNPAAASHTSERLRRAMDRVRRPETDVVVVNPGHGPADIASEADEALAGPHTLALVRQVLAQEYHAIVLASYTDAALDAVKEMASVPVLGFGEAGLQMAALLGRPFAIVTALLRSVPIHRRHLRKLGLTDACASIETVEVPGQEAALRPEDLSHRILEAADRAVRRSGAGTIVLGSAGLAENARHLSDLLGVAVLDPAAVALALAEAFIDLGLCHSKIGRFATPAPKG